MRGGRNNPSVTLHHRGGWRREGGSYAPLARTKKRKVAAVPNLGEAFSPPRPSSRVRAGVREEVELTTARTMRERRTTG